MKARRLLEFDDAPAVVSEDFLSGASRVTRRCTAEVRLDQSERQRAGKLRAHARRTVRMLRGITIRRGMQDVTKAHQCKRHDHRNGPVSRYFLFHLMPLLCPVD